MILGVAKHEREPAVTDALHVVTPVPGVICSVTCLVPGLTSEQL